MTRSWIDKECNGWCVQGCVMYKGCVERVFLSVHTRGV